MKRHYTAVSTR